MTTTAPRDAAWNIEFHISEEGAASPGGPGSASDAVGRAPSLESLTAKSEGLPEIPEHGTPDLQLLANGGLPAGGAGSLGLRRVGSAASPEGKSTSISPASSAGRNEEGSACDPLQEVPLNGDPGTSRGTPESHGQSRAGSRQGSGPGVSGKAPRLSRSQSHTHANGRGPKKGTAIISYDSEQDTPSFSQRPIRDAKSRDSQGSSDSEQGTPKGASGRHNAKGAMGPLTSMARSWIDGMYSSDSDSTAQSPKARVPRATTLGSFLGPKGEGARTRGEASRKSNPKTPNSSSQRNGAMGSPSTDPESTLGSPRRGGGPRAGMFSPLASFKKGERGAASPSLLLGALTPFSPSSPLGLGASRPAEKSGGESRRGVDGVPRKDDHQARLKARRERGRSGSMGDISFDLDQDGGAPSTKEGEARELQRKLLELEDEIQSLQGEAGQGDLANAQSHTDRPQPSSPGEPSLEGSSSHILGVEMLQQQNLALQRRLEEQAAQEALMKAQLAELEAAAAKSRALAAVEAEISALRGRTSMQEAVTAAAAQMEAASGVRAEMERELLSLRVEVEALRKQHEEEASRKEVERAQEREREAFKAEVSVLRAEVSALKEGKSGLERRARAAENESAGLKMRVQACEAARAELEARLESEEEERYVIRTTHKEEVSRLEDRLDSLAEQNVALESQVASAERALVLVEDQLLTSEKERGRVEEKLMELTLSAAAGANNTLALATQKRELLKEGEELRSELAAAKREIGMLLDAQKGLQHQDWMKLALGGFTRGGCN